MTAELQQYLPPSQSAGRLAGNHVAFEVSVWKVCYADQSCQQAKVPEILVSHASNTSYRCVVGRVGVIRYREQEYNMKCLEVLEILSCDPREVWRWCWRSWGTRFGRWQNARGFGWRSRSPSIAVENSRWFPKRRKTAVGTIVATSGVEKFDVRVGKKRDLTQSEESAPSTVNYLTIS